MIRLTDVYFGYRRVEPVLQGAQCRIAAGLTLLLGPNGAGKSTLLKIIAGVERPERGTAALEGFDLWEEEIQARRNLVYVSEQPDLTPYATIRDVINLVCRLRHVPLGQGVLALEKAGLDRISKRSIRELSMGQRRRAVLAAAWVGEPKIAVLDEPLEAMDRVIRAEILAWIDRLLARGAAVVVATHDIEPFAKIAARALSVKAGLCQVFEPLPADFADRMKLFEELSRGSF
jgi:ABC-type multidrug transport system ATPase subunit